MEPCKPGQSIDLAGICLLPSRRLKVGSATLTRLLIPSWRFYEEVGEVPELLYREGPNPQSLGPWKRCLHPPTRGFVLNSRENLYLAARGAVGQLVSELSDWEIGESEDLADTVAYRLVANLVRAHIPAQQGFFQFRVRPQLSGKPRQDFLMSGVHSL